MATQMNNLLHKNSSSTHNKRPISLKNAFDNDGLIELKDHICRLEELNERLKYMMTEIRFLVTNTL